MNKIPGPTSGITLQDARRLQADTLGFLLDAVADYGDLLCYPIGFWKVYVLSHPDYVQHVLLDNWRNFSRETFQFQQFARVTGQGLLTTSGEYWQRHRRLVQPAFHRRHLSGMTAGMFRAVERMSGRWQEKLRGDAAVELDLDRELLRLALEIIGESLFSLDLTHEAAELSQELLELMHYVIYRSQNLLALPDWVPTARNRRFRTRLKRLDQLVAQMISNRRRDGFPRDDFLGLLLGFDGQGVSDREIRDEVVTAIIAGYETVASGMGWVFKLLIDHPAAADHLRQEFTHTKMTFEGLAHAPYLNQVIQEAFRLYPPSWLMTRRAIEADQIGPYELPANALVVISPYAVHRHREFWPDPERFDPQRFAGEPLHHHKFAHIPFGGGPHLCIGKPLAMLEASVTLAALLPQYDFLPPDSGVMPVVNPQVTLRPFPELRVKIVKRD